ncbi:MAG: hypothetical protein EP330_09490 [Deltaproteobacteria bacterium]|nr:MAG: hypothetical protein EP330_09490 [Deltaproteobacteria bacterium]
MTVFPEFSPFPLLMAVPFAITLIALHYILFSPLLAYLEARDKTIRGARDEAKSLTDQIEERLLDLEVRLKEARSQAAAVRKEARDRAHLQANEILAAARVEAEGKVTEATTQIAASEKAASAELKAQTEAIAGEIVTTILGREVA